MRIAIDARWIFPEITGIGAYTRELIREFSAMAAGHEFVLIFDNPDIAAREVRECALENRPNVRILIVRSGVYSLRSQILLPALLRAEAVSVYHSTNVMIPFHAFPRRNRRIRCAVTMHDLIPLVVPNLVRGSKKGRMLPLYRLMLKEIISRSDAIITDSEASRSDIRRFFPASDPAGIRVVPCGVSERFRAAGEKTSGAERFRVLCDPEAERILLYVGRADPYKNLAGAVKVLRSLREKCGFPVKLRVAGPEDPRYRDARALAARLGVAESITWTGYVPEEKLLELYATAHALIHPSLYEGFGLQVLEAMAAGLPVICSNVSSLPEVAGDAALLADPNDINGFAEGAARILSDPALALRLSEAGRRRASLFTWRRTAEQILKIYEELCS